MTYEVILRRKKDKYVARTRDWPELVIEEDSRDAALLQIKDQLAEYLSQPPEVVQIELDSPLEREDQPWLKFAGMWADDPTWDDFIAEVEAYRQQIDESNPDA